MKGLTKGLAVGLVLVGFVFSSALAARNTATQVIRMIVEPIAVIAVVGEEGNQTWLEVNPSGVITGSNEVQWATNMEGLRVTIHTLSTSEQNYLLKAQALVTKGNGLAQGWVVVTGQPVSLVAGVTREMGGCIVEYEALPKVPQPGSDYHTVVFTLVD